MVKLDIQVLKGDSRGLLQGSFPLFPTNHQYVWPYFRIKDSDHQVEDAGAHRLATKTPVGEAEASRCAQYTGLRDGARIHFFLQRLFSVKGSGLR